MIRNDNHAKGHMKHHNLKGTCMKKRGNAGFSFVEVLVALGIASLIMASVVTLVKSQGRIKNSHEQIVEVQQNIRSVMYVMERELKMAGYRGNTQAKFFTVPPGFIAPTDATILTFTYLAVDDGVDNNGVNGTDEVGELTTVRFSIYDGDGDGLADDLGRNVDDMTAVPECIAENIELIEFYYTSEADDGTVSQSTDPTDLTIIKSVQISALAKSRKAVPVNTGGAQYVTASGETWGDDENFDDGLYRRFATSTILCRNLM